jgi:hypothetical protein
MILVSEYSESYFLSDINPNNPDNDWDIEDSLTYETEYENEPLAFRDLVKYLCDEGFAYASDSVISAHTTVSTRAYENRYGLVTTRTIALSHKNNPKSAKYWIKAIKTVLEIK